MSKDTKLKIIESVKKLFATQGYESISMRTLAAEVGISQSVLYHYFDSKDEMLNSIFEITRKEIGVKRARLKEQETFIGDLKERIKFQFDNATDVIFILKYFFHYREEQFPKHEQGFVPVQAYKHIEEVLDKWIDSLVIEKENIAAESKIVTHAINGFVMEYYPDTPRANDKEELINSIANFISRSLLETKSKGGEK